MSEESTTSIVKAATVFFVAIFTSVALCIIAVHWAKCAMGHPSCQTEVCE